MQKSFVSAFKLDGVPILPPLITDEVRAMVELSRQQAVAIEQKLLQKRRNVALQKQCLYEQSEGLQQPAVLYPSPELDLSTHSPPDTREEQYHAGDFEIVDESPQADHEDGAAGAPASAVPDVKQEPALPVPPEKSPVVLSDQQTSSSFCSPPETVETVNTIVSIDPDDQTIAPVTRTVTPTSEQMLPWVTLVRSNTFDLKKPTIDLSNLEGLQHSTPVDRSKGSAVEGFIRSPKGEVKSTPARTSSKTGAHRPTPAERIRPHTMPRIAPAATALVSHQPKQPVPLKRKSRNRKISNCSAASSSTVNLSVESISSALSEHEQRMAELLKRQEEERLLLEKSFREQTQELVALCAKSLPVANETPTMAPSGSTDIKPALSVSLLSLCDVSYESCSDTDDAAYQTCQNNGTSEERLSSNGETALAPASPRLDTNGNRRMANRIEEERLLRAGTIINAYARGYLTRRLFRTQKIQSIKQTIVDNLCLILNSRNETSGKSDPMAVSLRRKAFQRVALCLDNLHEIFIDYTPQKRLQMIQRDRYLKQQQAAHHRQNSPSLKMQGSVQRLG
ncbi:uncharacterized protein LOC131207000 [Anopheles bellator]|uniref:uncharacterized protein LOC131207000 n=1 Tax=Anopheles bellator TaxID=139047 RepID=UPI002648FEAE|nr:uncharacterized protein LOC131207000 [Anopheles bellator]